MYSLKYINAPGYAVMIILVLLFFCSNSRYRIVISFEKEDKQTMLEFLFRVRQNRTFKLGQLQKTKIQQWDTIMIHVEYNTNLILYKKY